MEKNLSSETKNFLSVAFLKSSFFSSEKEASQVIDFANNINILLILDSYFDLGFYSIRLFGGLTIVMRTRFDNSRMLMDQESLKYFFEINSSVLVIDDIIINELYESETYSPKKNRFLYSESESFIIFKNSIVNLKSKCSESV